ncbi:MAG: hypothetical protein ACOCXP_03260 [Candidatus Dojkabacteria bacterium]
MMVEDDYPRDGLLTAHIARYFDGLPFPYANTLESIAAGTECHILELCGSGYLPIIAWQKMGIMDLCAPGLDEDLIHDVFAGTNNSITGVRITDRYRESEEAKMLRDIMGHRYKVIEALLPSVESFRLINQRKEDLGIDGFSHIIFRPIGPLWELEREVRKRRSPLAHKAYNRIASNFLVNCYSLLSLGGKLFMQMPKGNINGLFSRAIIELNELPGIETKLSEGYALFGGIVSGFSLEKVSGAPRNEEFREFVAHKIAQINDELLPQHQQETPQHL